MTQADEELRRIKNLSAFNIPRAIKRRKLNQHLARYDFNDGSYLEIYATTSLGRAFDMNGTRIMSRELNVNSMGD